MTESRDRKQKEAAIVFVVAEECGNVEALCQTFLKWGQVTFSQRGKATTTTTKKSEGWGEGTAAPVSLRRSRRSRERGGESLGGLCGAWRGQRAQFPAGVGRRRRFLRCRAWGWRGGGARVRRGGCATGGGSSATCVALGLAQTPRAGSGGLFFGPRLDSPSPFKESFDWSECESVCPRCGPLRPHTVRVAPFVSLIPGRRRAGQRLRGR